MAARPESEPVIPTRNAVDRYWVDTLRYPTLGYAVGPILIAAAAAIAGGA